MSRTRKTRPLHVRMADPNDNGVGYIEVHNHVNGRDCDLPESPNAKTMEGKTDPPEYAVPYKTTKPCHYSWTYQGTNLCGCRMCTGHDLRKQDNRKTRHESKEGLHDALKSHEVDGDEF